MNLGTNLVSSTYQYLLNQSGSSITLGDNSSVNWGANNLVTTTGNQSIGGVKTFTSNLTIQPTLNFASHGSFVKNGAHVITFNTNANTSITSADTSARTYTIPNVSSDASFVLNAGTQTVGGIKTFSNNTIFNGSVGIGESSPTSKLNIIGDGLIAKFAGTADANQGIVIQTVQSSASVDKNAYIAFRNENDINLTTLFSYHNSGGDSDFAIGTTPSGNRSTLRRVERFRIKGNGDTTIGPGSGLSLQVIGGIRARGGVPGSNGVNNNGYAFSSPGDNDAGMFSSADGQIEFYTNNSERIRVTSNGDVGIGTTGAPNRLNVSGGNIGIYGASSTSAKLHLYNNALNTNGLEIGQGFANGSDNIAYIYNRNNAGLIFATNNTRRAIIASDGKFGINTNSPNAIFDIGSGAGDSSLIGTAHSNFIRTNAGALGLASGNTLNIASIGYRSSNNNSLTIQARRQAAGADWNTTAIGFLTAVDNTQIVNNSQVWMTASGTVSIGTDDPSNAAVLQLDSSTKGFLPPRLTTAQISAITNPVPGLLVYNTTTNRINVRTLSTWSGLVYGPQ